MPRKQVWAYECDECGRFRADEERDEDGEYWVSSDWLTEDDGKTFCSLSCRMEHYREVPQGRKPDIIGNAIAGLWAPSLAEAAYMLSRPLQAWGAIHIPDLTNKGAR